MVERVLCGAGGKEECYYTSSVQLSHVLHEWCLRLVNEVIVSSIPPVFLSPYLTPAVLYERRVFLLGPDE